MTTVVKADYRMTFTNASNPWLAHHLPNPRAKLRLFCLPYAGGAASIYQDWAEKLPEAVEVCPIQPPMRGARINEEPFTRIAPLVRSIASAVGPLLNKPYALFGHSMGALVSFELARHFRRERAPLPIHLFVSGRCAPQLRNPDPPKHDLPEVEFIEELRKLNGTPREVLDNQELMRMMMPLLRADFSVCETYTYTEEPPLACPITALGGLQDHEITPQMIEAWRAQTNGTFVRRMFPGDHFYLHSEKTLLLRLLAQDLYHIEKMISR
jgi:medium-chain acyl-[acyl-carrier-protein] hydrolase